MFTPNPLHPGLSGTEAAKRLLQFGANRLHPALTRPIWLQLLLR